MDIFYACYRCKFFLYTKNRFICELYSSMNRTCRSARGPPVNKTQGCPFITSTMSTISTISTTTITPPTTRVARRDLDQQGSLTLTLKFKFFSSQGKNFHYFSNSSQGLKSWKNQGYFKGNPWNPLNFKARLIKECWLQVKGWVVEIPKNPWKSLKILENIQKSLKILDKVWKYLEEKLKFLENPWKFSSG